MGDPPRKPPFNLPRAVSEPNVSRTPHTPVPDAYAAPTEPPPAMPMKPPKELQGPRKPMGSIRDSREISTDAILAELAHQAEEARAAKAEAEALRVALDAAKSAAGDAAAGDRKALVKLAYKLGTPLVALIVAATAWLTAHTATVEAKVDRVEQSRTLDKVVTDPLPAKVETGVRAVTDCKAWARATDDYYRQVFGKLGVSIPQQPDATPFTPIETRAPLRKAHTVTGATVLEILTPPPPLP